MLKININSLFILVGALSLDFSLGQDTLFLVGGYNQRPLDRVELLDLTNKSLECQDPAPFPDKVTG